MSKVAHYLQQHLVGEVLTGKEVLDYFSTDESIFSIRPLLVVHPRNESDVRKAARFSWQLAERGRIVPLTMKGIGSDQTGASLGNGIIISSPAHLNKIVELDPKSGIVSVESGAVVSKLQQTLFTHGRFLPSMTSSSEYSTIGGAVANNDSGRESYRYGPIREFVHGLRVVLANGELITTSRLSKRELNKKLGLASFEGEIYRSLDKLIEESQDKIEYLKNQNVRVNSGYALADVKLKDGSFDLTPLFVGSQGTLGLLTEVSLDTEAHNPKRKMIIAQFPARKFAWEAVNKINEIKSGPISLDFIDKTLISYVQQTNPNLLKNTLADSRPETVLFIELDSDSSRNVKKNRKRILKIIEEFQGEVAEPSSDDIDTWISLRECASQLISFSQGSARALPLVGDMVLPVENAVEFIEKAEKILLESGQKALGFWGYAGNGVINAAPLFDISQIGEKQKMFKLLDKYTQLVVDLGGGLGGQNAEGRLKGGQISRFLPPEIIELNTKVKKIFDPYKTLNPNVKVAVDLENLKSMLRNSYKFDHQHSFLPRS